MIASSRKGAAIIPGAVYPLSEFQKLFGLGVAAMREARRRGLVVRYLGRKAYVAADDFLKYLDEHAATSRPTVGAGAGEDGGDAAGVL